MLRFKLFSFFSSLSVLSLFLVIFLHVLANDILLFHSDIYSLSLYLSAAALIISLFLFAILAPLYFYSKRKHYYINSISTLIFILILFILLLNGFELLFKDSIRELLLKFNLLDILKNALFAKIAYYVLAPLLGILIVGFIIYSLYKHQNIIGARIVHSSNILFISMLSLLLFGMLFNHFFAHHLSKNPNANDKHLIVFIIDALPVQYTQTYDANMPKTGYDSIFSESYFLKNFYTSAPYTDGFFSILYTEKPHFARYGTFTNVDKRTREITYDNLLSRLNRNNVSTKVITFHGNGIPEWTSASVTKYDGLRSFFLTRKLTWLPKTLGIKYHPGVSRHSDFTTDFLNQPQAALFTWLSDYKVNSTAPYIDYLIENIEHNRKNQQSFTLVHLRFDASYELCMEQQPTFFGYFGKDINNVSSDYAKDYEDLLYSQIQCTGENFQKIIRTLQKSKRNEDTVMMITADHGYLFDFDTKRYGYSYHPDDEVIRVSLAILGTEKQGDDDRLFSTPDLTRTILNYFDISSYSENNDVNFFTHNDGHTRIHVLTRHDASQNEWFLITLDKETGKWIFNIAPNGDGKVRLISLNNKTVLSENVTDEELYQHKDFLLNGLKEYQLENENLHPRFHELISS